MLVFSIQSAMMIVRLWLPIADVRDHCVQASPFVGLLPASVGFAGLRFQGWTAAEGRLRLLSLLSQASQLSESIAWRTLNRRGTRDGTQNVSRAISDQVCQNRAHSLDMHVRSRLWCRVRNQVYGPPMASDIRDPSVGTGALGYALPGGPDHRHRCLWHDENPRCVAA